MLEEKLCLLQIHIFSLTEFFNQYLYWSYLNCFISKISSPKSAIFLDLHKGKSYEFMLVRLYVCNQFVFGLCFSELLRSDRDLETEKSDRDGFPKHIVVCPKMDKKGSK